MKECPVLFNAEMVKAILSGRKTQTRRVISAKTLQLFDIAASAGECHALPYGAEHENSQSYYREFSPLGRPGDQLWVREAWRVARQYDKTKPSGLPYDRGLSTFYEAGGSRARMEVGGPYINDNIYPVCRLPWVGKLRPSLHMPRAASRTDLLITGVRIERLNDISEADARAEGIEDGGCLTCGECEPCGCDRPMPDATDAFARLWQSIYGDESWFSNPWVWVTEFQKI